MLAREAHLSLHYFCDQAGKLLGIQSNTDIKKAISNIKSTAWDLFLLRFPELLFNGSPEEMCIAYVTAQEKKLQELASLFSIERLVCIAENGFSPMVSYNTKNIPEAVIDKISQELDLEQFTFSLSRKDTLKVPVGLLDALQNALAYFCAKK